MTKLRDGDRVEIKDHLNGKWTWSKTFGTVTDADKHCLTVHRESGVIIRDVLEHFRAPR